MNDQDHILSEVPDFLAIPDAERKAMADMGLTLEPYARSVTYDGTVPQFLQSLLVEALRFVPPAEHDLKGRIEGALSLRYD